MGHKNQCLAFKAVQCGRHSFCQDLAHHTNKHTQSQHGSVHNAGVSCPDMMNHVLFLLSFQLGFL